MSEQETAIITPSCHTSSPEPEIAIKPQTGSLTSLNAPNPLEGDTSLSPDNTLEQIELSECKLYSKNDEQKEEAVIKEVNVKSKKVRQRIWTTVLSAIVACIPFLLVGCTLGFPSGALLDLTDLEERTEFKLTREQADLFGVSMHILTH